MTPFYDVIKVTSTKTHRQNDVIKFSIFTPPPLAKSWLQSWRYYFNDQGPRSRAAFVLSLFKIDVLTSTNGDRRLWWWIGPECRDRNDHQPPGCQWHGTILATKIIVHILFGLFIHLHLFQVIEWYLWVRPRCLPMRLSNYSSIVCDLRSIPY